MDKLSILLAKDNYSIYTWFHPFSPINDIIPEISLLYIIIPIFIKQNKTSSDSFFCLQQLIDPPLFSAKETGQYIGKFLI